MLLKNCLTPEDSVIHGLTRGDHRIKLSLIGEPGRRQKVEIAPLYLPLPYGQFRKIFSRAGQVVSDPLGENDSRPVSHCYEDHVENDTQRWSRDEYPDYVRLIEEACSAYFSWDRIYSDGGSTYYRGQNDVTMRKQVSNKTGRTMIGVLVPHVLYLYGYRVNPLRIDFNLQYRIVVADGNDQKYSPEGTTQFAFGGLGVFSR